MLHKTFAKTDEKTSNLLSRGKCWACTACGCAQRAGAQRVCLRSVPACTACGRAQRTGVHSVRVCTGCGRSAGACTVCGRA